MSIGNIGTNSGLNPNQNAMLAQINAGQTVTGVTADSDGDFDGSVGGAVSTGTTVSTNGLTGATKTSISNQILALLTQLQQLQGTQATAGQNSGSTSAAATSTSIATLGTAASSTPTTSTGTSQDPLSQLFSAMDSNGDGTISQSEMESYIQSQGGTSAEADALYSGLNQGSTGNLTQTQLASDLQQAHATGSHHHHHHAEPSADQVGSDLVSAMDTNGNGSVNQSEFQQFVTAQGGTSAEASTDFAALDPTNTGSVNAAQFSTAIKAFESANNSAMDSGSNGASPILTPLDGISQSTLTPSASTNMIA